MQASLLPWRITVVAAALLVTLVRAVPASQSDALPYIKVDPQSRTFIDTQNRTRVFHGVNIVYKVPPFYPPSDHFDPMTSLTDDDIDLLVKLGFTSVRLFVSWAGTEVAPWQYNHTYLDEVHSIVNRLGEKGIYSILDAHQDLLARQFCGEGAPTWLFQNTTFSKPYPWPLRYTLRKDENGLPLLEDCVKHPFFQGYISKSVSEAFQRLYDNAEGIQDHFIGFWKAVAERFAGNSFVLGYEVLNEPWVGDFYENKENLLAGYSDRHNLQPLYERVHHAIRSVDDEHILFFEPVVMTTYVMRSGFSSGPGGPAYNDRQVYSYHVYCGFVSADGDPRTMVLCNPWQGFQFHLRLRDAKKLGIASFLTEFGADTNQTLGIDNINDITDDADRYSQSWTYWMFKPFKDFTTQSHYAPPHEADSPEGLYDFNGNLQQNKVHALARPYPHAVAGEVVSYGFSSKTKEFHLEYHVTKNVAGDTEVFSAESIQYPEGYELSVSPRDVSVSRTNGDMLVISHANANLAEGDAVSITLRPRTRESLA